MAVVLLGLAFLIVGSLGPSGSARAYSLPSLQGIAPEDLSQAEIQQLPPELRAKIKQAQNGESSAGLQQKVPAEQTEMTGQPAKGQFRSRSVGSVNGTSPELAAAQPLEVSVLEQRYRQDYGFLLEEKDFRQFGEEKESRQMKKDLRQFGYDLFQTGAEYTTGLVVPDKSYVLGPGDQLRIRLLGSSIDTQYTAEIAADGTINVPKLGIVSLAGTQLGEAAEILRNESEKYVQGINIDVSLQKLRSIEVYVVGAVKNPGLHLVPAFSTVLKGLISAGGVYKYGTLRDIRMFRGDKLYKSVDLYQLILEGKRSEDKLLKNNDVLFVPRIKRTAAVTGAVQQGAIFELRDEDTLGELLELAGGDLPQAFAGRIYLRRFVNNKEFRVKDIDTTRDPDWESIPIQDGDLLEMQLISKVKGRPKVVRLTGNVWFSDVYEYQPGLKLSQVLDSRELIKPGAIMDFALLHRYDQKLSRYRTIQFPLNQVFAGGYDRNLAPHDRIEILSRDEFGIKQTVTLKGAVWKPGEYALSPGLTLDDLVAMAGGTLMGAATGRVELSRQRVVESRATVEHVSLDLRRNADTVLQPNDYVFVPRLKNTGQVRTVEIRGEVNYPGTYSVSKNERLSDLIVRAGGFTDDAYFYGAKFTSDQAQKIQQKSIDKMIRELELKMQLATSTQAQKALSEQDLEAAGVIQGAS